MSKFDIEPCRGITDPDKESIIRVRSKIRKQNRDRIDIEKKNKEDKKEFGSGLAVFEQGDKNDG